MRSALHLVLVLAITVGYVTGFHVAIEVEHSHEVCEGHGHHQHGEPEHGHSHSHGSHRHHHGPASHGDHHEDDEDEMPHTHSHEVMVSADAPVTLPSIASIGWLSDSEGRYELPDQQRCPDGPFYPLIKPPQLG